MRNSAAEELFELRNDQTEAEEDEFELTEDAGFFLDCWGLLVDYDLDDCVVGTGMQGGIGKF